MEVFTPSILKVQENGEIKGYYPSILLYTVKQLTVPIALQFHTENLGLIDTESRGLVGARLEAMAAATAYCDILNKSVKHGLDIGNFKPSL